MIRAGFLDAETRQDLIELARDGSPYTVEKAREKAAILLGRIADGEDPSEIREADRAALSVEELCTVYLKEGCATKKASTLIADRGRIARHIIPLLGDKRVPQHKDNKYVFASSKEGAHVVGIQKVWERLRASAKLDGLRIHDLRHSFASVGAASGDSLLMIGALLGHKDAKTTARYVHLSNDPLKQTADRISGAIAEAIK